MPSGRDNIGGRPPSDFFKQLYFDVVSSYQPAIDYFYREYGSDHLLFGSDYPWVQIDSCVELVENLPASDEEKKKIYSENALSILKH
jgi:predicted TIM-barrel fold metal-dependent hydrolase